MATTAAQFSPFTHMGYGSGTVITSYTTVTNTVAPKRISLDTGRRNYEAYLNVPSDSMVQGVLIETVQQNLSGYTKNRYMLDLSKQAKLSAEDLAKHESEVYALHEATERTLLSLKKNAPFYNDVLQAMDLLREYVFKIEAYKKDLAKQERKHKKVAKKYGQEIADLLRQTEEAEKKVTKILKT